MFRREKLLEIRNLVLVLAGLMVLMMPQLADTPLAASPPEVQARQERTSPLAEYLPADSTLYASLRTDDGYIDELDAALALLNIPGLAETLDMPLQGVPTDVRSLLDLATLAGGLGGNFETAIRPWLGDHLALGMIVDASGTDAQGVVAIDITSKEAALNFVNNSPMGAALTQSEVNGYTVLEGVPGFTGAINDSVVLLATDRTLLPIDAPLASTLASNPTFTASMNSLPADSYNIYAYFDLGFVLQSASALDPESAAVLQTLGLDQYGGTGLGATILNGNTLTIDYVQSGDGFMTQVENFGLAGLTSGATNPGFLANIPSDSSMIIHGRSLRSFYDALTGLSTMMGDMDPEGAAEIEEGLAEIEFGIQGMTGLDLEADILSWMTGDYVLFVSGVAPEPGVSYLGTMGVFNDGSVNIGLDAGLVIEAVEAEKARAVVDALANAIMEQPLDEGTSASREEIAGASALVLTLTDEDLAMPLDLIVAANDNVFVIGTRAGATTALQGSGGLNNAPVNQTAAQHYLPNAYTSGYISRDGIIILGDLGLAASATSEDVFSAITSGLGSTEQVDPDALSQGVLQGQQQVRAAISRINNMTLSSTITDDKTAIGRITITLGG